MTERTIDVDSLLEPITPELPAGSDLRTDTSPLNDFQQIKDKRNKARQLEKQTLFGPNMSPDAREESTGRGKSPESTTECWKFVKDKSLDVLKRKSKDAEVAAYLIEALLRLDSFAGLHDGLRTMRELVDRFWDNIYPRPDEDGIETTVLPISRLDSEVLTSAIKRVPLTQGTSVGPFAAWQYRQAEELVRCSPEERQTRIDRGAVTKEMFSRAARETSTEFFQETNEELDACRDEFKGIAELLGVRCPEYTPTFSAAFDALDEVQSSLRLIAGPRLVVKASSAAGSKGSAEGENMPSGSNFVDNPVNGREDAFRTLESIADFFERTEPQSLIPAQLRKVVRWGRMRPSQLYSELIEDSSLREQIFKLVGIAAKEEEQSDESPGYEPQREDS